MMQPDELTATGLRTARLQELSDSLSNRRTQQDSDIILICHDDQFFAHKLILETASPYFASMFSSNMKEAMSGRINFSEMKSETLELVLDFIYTGKVNNIKTENQYMEVLAAAHLLQLEKLFKYCCNYLGNMLSLENFVETFHINERYDSEVLRKKVESFWISNSKKVLATTEFLSLSDVEIKVLVNCLKSKRLSLDAAIEGVVRWLRHDLKTREKFAEEVLKSIDGKLLSTHCVKLLFQDEELMNLSPLISSGLKELILHSFSASACDVMMLADTNDQSWTTKLSYFSQHCIVDVLDPTSHSLMKTVADARTLDHSCMQQFDLRTMTWLAPQYPSFSDCSKMYQYNNSVYMFHPSSIKQYNLRTNGFSTQSSPEDVSDFGAICCFRHNFYSFGGKVATRTVSRMRPGTKKWTVVNSLLLPQKQNLTVLTSGNCVYVIGENAKSEEELVIQYSKDPEDGQWEIILIRKEGLDYNQFFVINYTLMALHFNDNECKLLVYDQSSKMFTSKSKVHWPDQELTSLTLCKFQNYSSSFVFFSKVDDNLHIPYFLWEPETGSWAKLHPPKGKCNIPQNSEIRFTYSCD